VSLSRSKIKEIADKGGNGKFDLPLSLLIGILVIVGLVIVSSATAVLSKTVAGKDNAFFYNQLQSAGLGLIVLFIVSKVNYQFWRKLAKPFLFVNYILLIALFIPGIGSNHNGSTRWITFGSFNFQPSEFVKLGMILFLASWLAGLGDDIKDFKKGLLPFLGLVGSAAVLILKQPDMGTTMVVVLTSSIIFFVAGASFKHLAGLIGVGLTGIASLIIFEPYRLARLTTFLDPSKDKSGAGYQINQALIAIGSGGILGLGFGKSRQKFNYLPEAATDSIFAVISEELGFIRTALILIIFLAFIYRAYKVASTVEDKFGRLVAIGITSMIASQVVINIFAIMSLMPLTGVPLPFISLGGSNLITLLFSCGILLNISRYAKEGGRNASISLGRGDRRSHFAGTRRHNRARQAR
jgi:cell division protein FtsW